MIIAKNNRHLRKLVEMADKGLIRLEDIDTSRIINFSYCFESILEYNKDKHGSFEGWNVSNGVYFDEMFSGVLGLYDADFSKWDMSKAVSISGMFRDCYDFEGKGLEFWNLQKVRTMSFAFYLCINFDANVSKWNPKKCLDFSYAFSYCRTFKAKGIEEWQIDINKSFHNLSGKQIKASLEGIFHSCESIDHIDFSKWTIRVPINTYEATKHSNIILPHWWNTYEKRAY